MCINGDTFGIVEQVNAGRAFADYYRLLTPGKRYEGIESFFSGIDFLFFF